MEDIQTVKSGIEKLLLELNYDLSVFNFKKKNGGNVLEIVIDSIDPISMEDIVSVSEKISTYLDEHDFTTSNYTLDVSSLGAEKPIDVAVTLMARDYKGLDNYGSNGVIEWK